MSLVTSPGVQAWGLVVDGLEAALQTPGLDAGTRARLLRAHRLTRHLADRPGLKVAEPVPPPPPPTNIVQIAGRLVGSEA